MGIFRTLYRYECKKILCRKITWIAFGLCVVMVMLSLCMNLIGNYYVNGQVIDSNYHMFQTDQKYAEALNGRAIDQTLLEETVQAYRKIPSDAEIYITTTEYQQYARPYSAIFNFIHQATPLRSEEIRFNWQPDEADFYAQRQQKLQAIWDESCLSAGEIQYWQNEEAKIQTPFIFQRFDGYDILFSSLLSIGLVVLMFISICLPGLFPYEQSNKTDQIVMCCPLGKTRLYWAKIAAGASFAVGSTVIICGLSFAVTACLYGLDGFRAACQLMMPGISAPLSCGEAILIAYGCMIVTALLISVLVMIVSAVLHSNIATLAIFNGLMIVAMIVNIPEHFRVLYQLWAWLPWSFLTPWNVFDCLTLPLFGHYFTSWQAVPVIYLLLSVAVALVGRQIYKRYQINGR